MAEENILEYKGRPLARLGNDIYYGAPTDPYVIYMQIIGTKDVNGTKVADNVQMVLLSTDTSLSMKDRMKQATVRHSLYEALELGTIWLEKVQASK